MTDLSDWKPCELPDMPSTGGAFVRVHRFRPERDAAALFAAIGGPHNDVLWRHIPFGPFESAAALRAILAFMKDVHGWQTLVFRARDSGETLGTASYMRIRPEAGSAEVGCVVFSKALQRTPAATEAMYFMARHLFDDLGYRRYEWKCDNDNVASRNAAVRFGFAPEGVFRQDMVIKGRNRDTAWFSMLDREWPRIDGAFQAWLAPENFDAAGKQRRSLAEMRNALGAKG
jgi:RimJ/RimL family protein N-acetyltransferase